MAASEVPLGREAEALARGLLRRAGMEILDSNVRTPAGELDVVAREGETLVFVEVKARSSAEHGLPEEFVDARKRARLTGAAEAFLSGMAGPQPVCRFDVVAVETTPAGLTMRHIRDAFRPGE